MVKRDSQWGVWLTVCCLAIAVALGWEDSFRIWPVWVLILLGVVFGVFTLVVSLPRTYSTKKVSSEFERHFLHGDRAYGMSGGTAETKPRGHDEQSEVGRPAIRQKARKGSMERGGPELDLARCLERAKAHLNRGDAESALSDLETFAVKDIRGIHTASSEYYNLLGVCQRALGKDPRNVENQVEELKLDWITALKKGQRLLKAGKAKESIAYCQRSPNANPGEYGTASGEKAARLGVKSAEALLKRQKQS